MSNSGYNIQSPVLGQIYSKHLEHKTSYAFPSDKLPKLSDKVKSLYGLGVQINSYFVGVSTANIPVTSMIRGDNKNTSCWISRSGCRYVQVSVDVKRFELAYLDDTGVFTNVGTGKNVVGLFEGDSFVNEDGTRIAKLSYECTTPIATISNGGADTFVTANKVSLEENKNKNNK